jgi:hypothetical protein
VRANSLATTSFAAKSPNPARTAASTPVPPRGALED